MQELMLLENPYRRRNVMARRKSRRGGGALAMPAVAREWFGGMDFMDMGSALGGLAAATMIPGMLVPTAATTMQKLMKVAASFGSAIAAGFVFRNVSANAGKYAIAGGIAGALAQTIGMFTTIKIGQPMGQAMLRSPAAPAQMRRISESRAMPYAGEDASVQVSTT